ncbi:MAG: hypothetical protein V1645_01540 [archaeon]
MRICPFCGTRVFELKVVVVNVATNKKSSIGLGRFWCSQCNRPLKKTLFRSNGNGHREVVFSNHDNGGNGFGHYDDLVDPHSLVRDLKRVNSLRQQNGGVTFKEVWTSQRSRPPQRPRYKFHHERVEQEVVWC